MKTEEKKTNGANEAWKALLEKYPIVQEVREKGVFHIRASQIKEFREPRLMAKWDSSSSLPEALRCCRLNLLPDSRGSYVIGDFLLYQELPELDEPVTRMDQVRLPEYESVDVNAITSEANAINVMILSGILDDFLGTDQNAATFSGKMGTGAFSFLVDTVRGVKRRIQVDNAQCEIDGGFENRDSVVILEAKNVVHEDFHVRQLYYPYRLWRERVRKPIRLVFSVYSNQIFRLFEYRFRDPEDYSSIELVQSRNYSLQDTVITMEELRAVREQTAVRTDDRMTGGRDQVPFVQANSMERIISLLEQLAGNPMTGGQIAERMNFEPRQSDYYFNAGRYLGLFEKRREDRQVLVQLTGSGARLARMNYKERQLKLVSLILEHQIFAECFDAVSEREDGTFVFPEKEEIQRRMRELHVCNEGQIVRRSSSVYGWLRWMAGLTRR